MRVNVRQKWNKKEGVGRGRLTQKFTLSWLVVAIHKAEIPMDYALRFNNYIQNFSENLYIMLRIFGNRYINSEWCLISQGIGQRVSRKNKNMRFIHFQVNNFHFN